MSFPIKIFNLLLEMQVVAEIHKAHKVFKATRVLFFVEVTLLTKRI